MDVTSFFNALATLRVFSVVMGIRVLVFDVLRNLGEAASLSIILAVSHLNLNLSHKFMAVVLEQYMVVVQIAR